MSRCSCRLAFLGGALALWASLFGPAAASADGPSFLEPGVAQHAFEAISGAVGKSFDVMGVRVTATELVVDVIPTDSATDAQTWRVTHKGLISGVLGLDIPTRVSAGTAVSRIGPIKDNRFPLEAEAFSVVSKLARETVAKARFETPGHVTEMDLRRLPAIVGNESKTPIWQINVAAVDEGADFGANLKGEITTTDLRRTNRAARLNLFAGGEDFDDFLARIRAETGKAWIFHRIEIDKQDIGLELHVASSPHAQVQHFNASISEIRTTAFDMLHSGLPGDPADDPFDLADIDFSQLLGVERAALDKLAIPKGVVTRIVVSRPHRENGASIEWTVYITQGDAPLFNLPGKPRPLEGSATFDGKGGFLRAVYPEGSNREANLIDPAQLKIAIADIASQLGAHEQVLELNVNPSTIRFRAADPKAPAKLVSFDYAHGLVSRTFGSEHEIAGLLGDGPDWRWDIALLTPDVIDRLAALTRQAIAARGKPNAALVGYEFTKDKPFYPTNAEPLIEIRTEADSASDIATFDFSGGALKALAETPARSGLFVNGKSVTDGAADDEMNACEYSDDPHAAISACSRWLDHHPDDPRHGRAIEYYNRGNGYMKLKQWEPAIADYTRALEVDPSYQRPYTNRAFSYLSSGEAELALADADKAIGFDPKKTFAFIVRAFAKERLGKWDAAVADFTIVLEQTNGDAQTYFNRGVAYYSGPGNLDHAIDDFNQAITRDPKNAQALVYRGLARRLKGDLDGAVADHADALRLDPRNAAAFFNRGTEYYLKGDLSRALADLSQATALAPGEPYLNLLLDVVAARSGLPSQLREKSAGIDMGAWPAPAIRLLLSQLTPDALAAAAADGPPSDKPRRLCEAAFYTGVALARAGKPDDAAAKWREALATCPHPTPERSYAGVELKAANAAKP